MLGSYEDLVRAHLAHHGITSDLASLVEVWLSPEDEEGRRRANITIGYADAGRRRETAMASLPSVDEAFDVLASRDRIGTLLSLGISAMPAARRPSVPDWIRQDDAARRARAGLRRARMLAHARLEGRDEADNKKKADVEGAPF